MASKALDEVRAKMLAVLHDLGPCSKEQAIEEFNRRHPDLNQAAAPDYQRMAQVKVISEVSARRQHARAVDPNQSDLFGGASYGIIPVPVIRNGKIVGVVRKDYLDTTGEEARAWIKSKERPERDGKVRAKGEAEILELLTPYLKPKMTLRQAAVIWAEAEKEKKA